MHVMVNRSIAKVMYLRAIPGHDPWKESPIKDFEAIADRFWEGQEIDIRQLILVGDLKFYFESILMSVLDWTDSSVPASKELTSFQSRVLDLIKSKGPIKRAVAALRLESPETSISRAVNELRELGHKIENDSRKGSPGYYLEES